MYHFPVVIEGRSTQETRDFNLSYAYNQDTYAKLTFLSFKLCCNIVQSLKAEQYFTYIMQFWVILFTLGVFFLVLLL